MHSLKLEEETLYKKCISLLLAERATVQKLVFRVTFVTKEEMTKNDMT